MWFVEVHIRSNGNNPKWVNVQVTFLHKNCLCSVVKASLKLCHGVVSFTKDSGKTITIEEKLSFFPYSPDVCITIQHEFACQHTSSSVHVHSLIT